MEHVLVVRLEIPFHGCHGAERLVDVVELVADLSDPQVDLLLAKVGVELDHLVEVGEARFQLALGLLDQAEAVMAALLILDVLRLRSSGRLRLIPAKPTVEVLLLLLGLFFVRLFFLSSCLCLSWLRLGLALAALSTLYDALVLLLI